MFCDHTHYPALTMCAWKGNECHCYKKMRSARAREKRRKGLGGWPSEERRGPGESREEGDWRVEMKGKGRDTILRPRVVVVWLVLRRTAAERPFFRFRGEKREGVASRFARIDTAALTETEAGAKGRVSAAF